MYIIRTVYTYNDGTYGIRRVGKTAYTYETKDGSFRCYI